MRPDTVFFFAISLIILSAAINRPGVQTAGGDDSGGQASVWLPTGRALAADLCLGEPGIMNE